MASRNSRSSKPSTTTIKVAGKKGSTTIVRSKDPNVGTIEVKTDASGKSKIVAGGGSSKSNNEAVARQAGLNVGNGSSSQSNNALATQSANAQVVASRQKEEQQRRLIGNARTAALIQADTANRMRNLSFSERQDALNRAVGQDVRVQDGGVVAVGRTESGGFKAVQIGVLPDEQRRRDRIQEGSASVEDLRTQADARLNQQRFNEKLSLAVSTGSLRPSDLIPRGGLELTPQNVDAIRGNIEASNANLLARFNNPNLNKVEATIFDYGLGRPNRGNSKDSNFIVSNLLLNQQNNKIAKEKGQQAIEFFQGNQKAYQFQLALKDNAVIKLDSFSNSSFQNREKRFKKIKTDLKFLGTSDNPVDFLKQTQRIFTNTALNLGSAGSELAASGFRAIIKPEDTLKGVASVLTTNPKTTLSNFFSQRKLEFQKDPVGTTALTLLDLELGARGAVGGTRATSDIVKDIYVRTGSKKLAPEATFASDVLTGKTNLPLSSSTSDSLRRFLGATDEQGRIIVQTSAPSKISGNIAGVGKKATGGFEDAGIYVTPKGEGSPAFLRIAGESSSYIYGQNPLQGFFSVPTVTRFAVKDVVLYPRNIVTQAGFKSVSKFAEDVLAPQAKAVITKRSEIGQGSVKRQSFAVDTLITDPFTGKKLQAGQKVIERGTSELEAVIPVGSQFRYTPKTVLGKLKGFDFYTEFNGKAVAIRDTELIETIRRGTTINPSSSVAKGGKNLLVNYNKLLKESSALSKSLSRPNVNAGSSIGLLRSSVSSNVNLQSSVRSLVSNDLSSSIPKSGSSALSVGGSSRVSTLFSDLTSSQPLVSSPVSGSGISGGSGISMTSILGGSSVSRPPIPIQTYPPYSVPVGTKPEEDRTGMQQGYDVLVQVGKKFVKVNEKPRTKSAAKDLLYDFLDKKKPFKGKLVPTKGKPEFAITGGESTLLDHKFTNKKNVYVEKKKYRNDRFDEFKNLIPRASKKGVSIFESKAPSLGGFLK